MDIVLTNCVGLEIERYRVPTESSIDEYFLYLISNNYLTIDVGDTISIVETWSED